MIITLAQLKTLLQITSSTYDTLINALIPIVEEQICEYCNNDFIDEYESLNGILPVVYFYSTEFYFATTDNSLNNTTDDLTTLDFKAGDTIRVYNSIQNEGILTIKSIAAHKIIFESVNTVNNESAGNCIVIARVKFPKTLQLTASQMIGYNLKKQTAGLISESIDDYSYTKDKDFINGYPKSIMDGLNDFRSLYKKQIPYNILYYRQA